MIFTVWRCDVCETRQETATSPDEFETYGHVCPKCRDEYAKIQEKQREAMQGFDEKWLNAEKVLSPKPKMFESKEVADGEQTRPQTTRNAG